MGAESIYKTVRYHRPEDHNVSTIHRLVFFGAACSKQMFVVVMFLIILQPSLHESHYVSSG
jgi:hypothetical protein